MDKPKTKSENRLRTAGLRMALKMIPDDLMKAAPAHLEKYLLEQLSKVEPETDEAGTVFMVAPQRDESIAVFTVTLDEENRIRREIKKTTMAELFGQIVNNLKEL